MIGDVEIRLQVFKIACEISDAKDLKTLIMVADMIWTWVDGAAPRLPPPRSPTMTGA